MAYPPPKKRSNYDLSGRQVLPRNFQIPVSSMSCFSVNRQNTAAVPNHLSSTSPPIDSCNNTDQAPPQNNQRYSFVAIPRQLSARRGPTKGAPPGGQHPTNKGTVPKESLGKDGESAKHGRGRSQVRSKRDNKKPCQRFRSRTPSHERWDDMTYGTIFHGHQVRNKHVTKDGRLWSWAAKELEGAVTLKEMKQEWRFCDACYEYTYYKEMIIGTGFCKACNQAGRYTGGPNEEEEEEGNKKRKKHEGTEKDKNDVQRKKPKGPYRY